MPSIFGRINWQCSDAWSAELVRMACWISTIPRIHLNSTPSFQTKNINLFTPIKNATLISNYITRIYSFILSHHRFPRSRIGKKYILFICCRNRSSNKRKKTTTTANKNHCDHFPFVSLTFWRFSMSTCVRACNIT